MASHCFTGLLFCVAHEGQKSVSDALVFKADQSNHVLKLMGQSNHVVYLAFDFIDQFKKHYTVEFIQWLHRTVHYYFTQALLFYALYNGGAWSVYRMIIQQLRPTPTFKSVFTGNRL